MKLKPPWKRHVKIPKKRRLTKCVVCGVPRTHSEPGK
jgi:hypothetical protein